MSFASFHTISREEQVRTTEFLYLNRFRTFMVQIAVLSNHQNGRDTHMRQIKIFAPVEGGPVGMASLSNAAFTTNDFSRFSCIR